MIGILRFIGVLNASIWIGAAVFLYVLLQFGIFSPAMENLFGAAAYKPYAGYIAQLTFKQFFRLQLFCAVIAALHLLGFWLYSGRPLQRVSLWIVGGLLTLSLLGSFSLQPKMERLFATKYSSQATPVQKEQATKSFSRWHGFSQVANLFLLGGLVVYLFRLTSVSEGSRFMSATKFRG